MTGFKLQASGIGSYYHSANRATTTVQASQSCIHFTDFTIEIYNSG